MKISIILAALTGAFETDMTRASKTADKRMREIEKTAKQVGKAVGAALAAAATAAAVAVKAAIDRADELSKAAQKIGITTEALSALSYAAELADVDLATLQSGLGRLTKFQAEAADGSEKQVELLKALGIEYQNLDGTLRDTEQVFRDFSNVFASLPDGADKSALALEVFGRSGANLIPLLNEGAAGLDDMRDRAEELGIVLSTEAGKQAEEFNDRLTDLKLAATGLATAVAIELLPDLNEMVESLADGTTEGDKFASTAQNIAGYLRAVGEVANFVIKGVQGIAIGIVGIATGTAAAIAQLTGMQDRASLASQLSADAFSQAGGYFKDAVGMGPAAAAPSFDWGAAEAGAQQYAAEAKAGNEAAAALKKLREQRAGEQAAAAGAAAARAAQAAAAREAAAAERELQKIHEAGVEAAADLSETIGQNAAELAGPAAEAARAYADEMVRLVGEQDKLAAASLLNADTERDLAIAREQAFEKYQRSLDDIEAQRTEVYDNLMSDMQFELELLGKTNLEREKAIALRYANVDAASAEGQAIAAALEDLDRAQQVAEGMDVVRDATSGLFEDLMSGAKSASDAFKDFVDNILDGIAQIVARNLTEQLLGSFGSTGGGQSGGFLTSLFGSFFGGGKAAGGPVMAGVPYLVGEQGPELVIPSASGTVIPAGKTAAMLSRGRGDMTVIVQGPTSRRALDRLRVERQREQNRATGEIA